jgi:hypothetical protein
VVVVVVMKKLHNIIKGGVATTLSKGEKGKLTPSLMS